MKKRTLTTLIGVMLLIWMLFVITVGFAEDTRTTPLPMIAGISVAWNWNLGNWAFLYYKGRGLTDLQAATYSNQAMQSDNERRLDAALTTLRATDPHYFDSVFASQGLTFKDAR